MTRLSLQNKLSLSLSIRKNDIGNKKKEGLTEAAFVVKEKHVKLYFWSSRVTPKGVISGFFINYSVVNHDV